MSLLLCLSAQHGNFVHGKSASCDTFLVKRHEKEERAYTTYLAWLKMKIRNELKRKWSYSMYVIFPACDWKNRTVLRIAKDEHTVGGGERSLQNTPSQPRRPGLNRSITATSRYGLQVFPIRYYLRIRKHGIGIHKTALKVGSLYSEDRRSVILYTTLHDIAYKRQ